MYPLESLVRSPGRRLSLIALSTNSFGVYKLLVVSRSLLSVLGALGFCCLTAPGRIQVRQARRQDLLTARRSVRASQSPRRPSTCGTVRSRILTSPQSDQLPTYR